MTTTPSDAIDRHAATKGPRAAIATIGTGSLSWSTFRDAVHGLAARLSKGTACLRLDGPDFTIAFLAACQAGAHIVLANASWTRFELEAATTNLNIDWVLSREVLDGDFEHHTPSGSIRVLSKRTAGMDRDILASRDQSIVIFTSGTTGKPMAVARTVKQMWAETHAYVAAVGLNESDRVATTTPLCHAYALVDGFLGALAAGATFATLDGRRTPRAVLRDLAEFGPTVLLSVPPLYKAIAATTCPELLEVRRRLRLAISAGAALADGTRERLQDALGVNLTNLYGTSETGTLSCERAACPGGAGLPIDGVAIEVRDGGGRLPTGQIGEIFATSREFASGYLGIPVDPAFQANGVFTGDLGFKDDAGNLHLIGRRADCISVGANRVDPQEVEDVIQLHPKVREVVVVASPTGEAERVAAVVVLEEGRACSLAELQAFAREHLSAYKVPSVLQIVDHIPTGSTGKISRTHVARSVFPQEVCVIVLTHGGIEHTRRCIASLIATNYPLLRVVVVDNGSPDETASFLLSSREQAAKRGVRLDVLLLERNEGAAKARNLGASVSDSPLLAFADNDASFPSPDWLRVLTTTLGQDPRIGIVGPKLLYPFEPHAIQGAGGAISPDGITGELGRGAPGDSPEFNRRREVQFISTACCLMTRRVFERSGGFSCEYQPYYFEGVDLCYRVKAMGYRLVYEPSSSVYHFENATAELLEGDLKRTVIRNQAKFRRRWGHVIRRENGPSAEELRWIPIPKPSTRELPPVTGFEENR